MSMRTLLELSWRKTKESATRQGYATVTPASAAGMYLEAADGDAERALSLAPEDDGMFFPLVRADLTNVIAEERAARGPRLKTGT